METEIRSDGTEPSNRFLSRTLKRQFGDNQGYNRYRKRSKKLDKKQDRKKLSDFNHQEKPPPFLMNEHLSRFFHDQLNLSKDGKAMIEDD